MQPYQDTLMVLIAKNDTLDNKEMTRVTIQISSNDTYNALTHKISGAKNNVRSTDFTTSNLTAIGMYYTEENNEFIKDCSDTPFFKRFAEKIEETEEFNCTKKCVPLIYDSLMDIINHSYQNVQTLSKKMNFVLMG